MTEGETEREREKLKRENEEVKRENEEVKREKEEEVKKRREALERDNEEMKREIERMKRVMKYGIFSIRDVNETVVKIPNREITIQKGNRFHNKTWKDETIIIGKQMSRV